MSYGDANMMLKRLWQLGRRDGRAILRALVGTALALGLSAQACDIPVCEYTLHNWPRDPYRVWYFYRDTEDPGDAAVNSHLQQAAESLESHANIAFAKVNVSELDGAEHDGLAGQVWARWKTDELPLHLALTPRGAELFAGRLDRPAAQAMLQSPKRQRLSRELSEGKQGLLLLLLGPDQAANAAAQKIVREVAEEAKEHEVDVGVLEVKRDDPQERWLVKQALSIEEDLKDLEHTMLFGVFGRGHLMEPFVGRGITKDNLIDLIAFLNGPCACTIKTADFGMDLLTNWDWEGSVAAALGYEEVLAEPLPPVAESAPSAASAAEPLPPAEEPSSPPAPRDEAEAAPAAVGLPEPRRERQPREHGPEPVVPETAPSEAAPPAREASRAELSPAAQRAIVLPPSVLPEGSLAAEPRESLAQLLLKRVGVIAGLVVLVVAAGSFVLIRRRRQS